MVAKSSAMAAPRLDEEVDMQHDEFVGQVQARARLADTGRAESAIRATLETLGERIPEGLAENLAAQLPREIGEHLRRTVAFGGTGTGERFDRNEFIRRVAERAGMDEPQAVFAARVVFELVDEATQGGIMQRVRDALPADLAELSRSGSQGQMGR
jgi:uncharacterized protein (DUF2267 family)